MAEIGVRIAFFLSQYRQSSPVDLLCLPGTSGSHYNWLMVSVRKLSPEEWPVYRALRLEALRAEPHAFAASYETNTARPNEYWQGRLQDAETDPRRTLLFAFDGEEAVGMVGAYPNEDGEVEVIA